LFVWLAELMLEHTQRRPPRILPVPAAQAHSPGGGEALSAEGARARGRVGRAQSTG
jgi:hypothetical protein